MLLTKEFPMKIYFKHSTRCPISARAKMEMDNFLKTNTNQNLDYELIDVISNHSRSDEVAKEFSIQHESPQIIITDNKNNIVWSASHRQITEENIKEVLKNQT